MLTDADRSLGHRLAGEWLERRGESDPLVLAEHFDRAGDPGQAAALYARGAELACSAGDSDSAILHAQRGLSLEPSTETRGALLGVLCHAYLWRFECDAAASLLDEALRLARPGSVPWVHAVAARFSLSVAQGSFDAIAADLQILLTTALEPEAMSLVALSVCSAVFVFDMVGQFEAARATLVQLDAIVAPVAARDPVARGWLDAAHANFAGTACNDPWRGLVLARDVAARFQDADYPSGLPAARLIVAMCLARLGAFDEAERALRSAVVSNEAVDFALLRDYYLARSLLDQGRPAPRESARTR